MYHGNIQAGARAKCSLTHSEKSRRTHHNGTRTTHLLFLHSLSLKAIFRIGSRRRVGCLCTAAPNNPAWKMPSLRVTIALNTQQSRKAVILLPASSSAHPDAVDSFKALIFKAAQSKLRLKKPMRVYVGQTGHELMSEQDWKSNITDDVVLLVSAGEEYVGAKREPKIHGQYYAPSRFGVT